MISRTGTFSDGGMVVVCIGPETRYAECNLVVRLLRDVDAVVRVGRKYIHIVCGDVYIKMLIRSRDEMEPILLELKKLLKLVGEMREPVLRAQAS